jgi:hypothetical protein
MEPRTGAEGTGAAFFGAAGCTGFAFPTESERPSPRPLNGLAISSGISTCFAAVRRTNKRRVDAGKGLR